MALTCKCFLLSESMKWSLNRFSLPLWTGFYPLFSLPDFPAFLSYERVYLFSCNLFRHSVHQADLPVLNNKWRRIATDSVHATDQL